MNPIRFRTNYRILPCYVALCVVCLLSVLILGSIDEQKYLPVMIGLFAVMGVATVLMLLAVPKTRRQELAAEEARYDFDTAAVEIQEQYVIDYEGAKLYFGPNGVRVDDGKFFWYSAMNPRLVTSNRFNRVWIAVEFGSDPLTDIFLPLSPVLIRAIEQLAIPLANPESLDYLLSHKSNAFAQIYNSGTFEVFDD